MRQKILIVDDTPADIETLNELFQDEHETYAALSGREGLELALSLDPDVILLDLMLPDLDGYEVCAKLADDLRTKDIPVVLLTALEETEDAQRGLNCGAADYLPKPFRPATAKMRVRNLLELKSHRDELSQRDSRDSLTGLPNRLRFERYLESEWQRSLRSGKPLSLVLLDLDAFHAYNELYGDTAGDECLRVVAQTLAAEVSRPGDLLARYGGGSFACLLPETEREGAWLVAEKLRQAIGDLMLPHGTSPVASHVTASGGVVACRPTAKTGPAGLVDAAKEALAQAKAKGRNQVFTRWVDTE